MSEPQAWCDKHAEFFRENGAAPEDIVKLVVQSLVRQWQERDGYSTKMDEALARTVLTSIHGQPFCCHLGDEKLKKILVTAALDVEKMKAKSHVS